MATIPKMENHSRPMPVAASRRLPSLDGWRAISIGIVLTAHSLMVPGCPGFLRHWVRLFPGDMGVRFFFVISGLLITWLMIGEHEETGRVSLRHFYIRRALRILPVYFAFLGVLFCLQIWTPFRQTPANWIANLTFTTNYVESSWTSGHLWSLSVEEQFYLAWPVIFVACKLAVKPRLSLGLLVVPLLIAPVWRVLSYRGMYPQGLSAAFRIFSFFNYFDGLAVGCMCAFLLRDWRTTVERIMIGRPISVMATGLGLVLAANLLGVLQTAGSIVVLLRDSMQALGFALLLLQSILSPTFGWYRALNWRWVRHLGVLSYSIYIWQQIFCTQSADFGISRVWWMSFPGWLLAAILAAYLSYYALERPLLRLRSRFR